jgi:coenzyme PQQ precursor peptide PqqA
MALKAELRSNAAYPLRLRPRERSMEEMMTDVTWTAPEACEICCGMEVTSYMSAEI